MMTLEDDPPVAPTAPSVAPDGSVARVAGLLDRPGHAVFGRWVRVLRRALHADGALVVLADGAAQVVVAADGVAAGATGAASPEVATACSRVLAADDTTVVANATRDGASTLLATFVGTPLRGPDGEALGVVAVVGAGGRPWDLDDITLLEELAELASGEVANRLAARQVRRFAEEVAHGLRNPVAALQAQLRVLGDHDDLGGDAQADLLDAQTTVQHLAGAVHALDGSVARLRFGHERVVHLPVVLEQVAGRWTTDARAQGRPVEVRRTPLPPSVAGADPTPLGPRAALRTDEAALHHVLDELVAVAMTAGTGPVELGLERASSWVRVRVETGGAPLPSAVARRLLARHDNDAASPDEASWAVVVAQSLGGRLVLPPADHPVLDVVLPATLGDRA